jgi:hypothetical protein
VGLRRRLDRLEEQAGPLRDNLTLPDGTVIELAPGERFDALRAALNEEEHPLLDAARRVGANEEAEECLRLLWAIQPGEAAEEETLEE